MAVKRMFTPDIISSDAFTEMSFPAQVLYFQINLDADDDGFCDRVNSIRRRLNIKPAALNELFERGFLIGFSERQGLVVVKHWRMHNTLRSDRYKVTNYLDFAKQLVIKPNKSYSLPNVVLFGDDEENSTNDPWSPWFNKW
ncbi:MAG: hypothetical protein M0Q41_13415 [Bacteroidales bacterium]|nr:hypothetical protein [Acholeplasmataceae bacterium]MCK9449955.1 hypothetical protein [Bacteroidales bacterium]